MNLINVKVIPRAKKPGVETDAAGRLVVRVHEPPEDGRANDAVIEALADHFRVPKRLVHLVRGHISRVKLIQINGGPRKPVPERSGRSFPSQGGQQ